MYKEGEREEERRRRRKVGAGEESRIKGEFSSHFFLGLGNTKVVLKLFC